MDQMQWKILTDVIRQAMKGMPRFRRFRFGDFLIVAMYFWAVKHDRAMMWACDRNNYSSLFRPRKLPSISQFHRRIKSPRVQAILQRINDLLAERSKQRACLIVDGKPLLVSNVSKDRDARKGYVVGGFGKGYKLHAFLSLGGEFVCWCVRPLNEHEMPIATQMLEQFPPLPSDGLLLADGNYDAHDFHKAVFARGGQLVCPLRGKATHPVTLRQMGEARRELIKLSDTSPNLVEADLRQRRRIETRFGNLTTMGLGPLPYFVRRLPRVRRWTGAKIALYHIRNKARKMLAQQKD